MSRWNLGPLRHPSSWRLLGVLGLAALILLPALRTGYWGEDVHHSVVVPGRIALTGGTVVRESLDHIKAVLLSGRFFPLTPVLISLNFHLIHDVAAYKAYLVLGVLVDVLLFYLLVREVSGRSGFACFASCVTAALFQMRVFADPILAASGQMQWVAAGTFFSLLALQRFLDGTGRGWLLAGAIAYLVPCLIYEASYPLILLHLVLIGRARMGWADRLWTALPLLAVVGFCGFQTVLMRWLHPSTFYVHNVSFDARRFGLALAHQISAALPLSYFLADPLRIFREVRDVPSFLAWAAEPRTVVVALAALVLSYASLRNRETAAGPRLPAWWLYAALGLLLTALPAVLIAISPYHQDQIAPGVGWIPVLIQDFGAGLLLATALWLPVERGPLYPAFARRKCAIAAALVAATAGVTHRANRDVAVTFNAPRGTPEFRVYAEQIAATTHEPRRLLEQALDSGLMGGVPDRSRVQTTNTYSCWYDPTFAPYFFAKHTQKAFELLPGSAPPPDAPGTPPVYRIRDVCQRRNGFVVLSRLDPAGPEAGQAPDNRGLRLFVRNSRLFRDGPEPSLLVVGQPDGSPTAPRSFRLGRDLPVIRSGSDWAIVSLDPLGDRVDPDSLRLQGDAAQLSMGSPSDRQ